MNPRALRATLLVLLLVGVAAAAGVFVAACSSAGASGSAKTPDFTQLIVATTTSLKDSGLLDDVVVPAYKELHPDVTVKIVAQGSGAAIEMARAGNADVLLVHSPADEEQFMADDQGTLRLPFAYNYFTIVGPPNDPAKVADAPDAATAFKQIYDSGGPVRQPRRRLRHQLQGAQALERGRSDVRPQGRPRLQGLHQDQPGHGADAPDRQREGRLHAHRHGDLPLAQDARCPTSSRCSRRARTSRTSTT